MSTMDYVKAIPDIASEVGKEFSQRTPADYLPAPLASSMGVGNEYNKTLWANMSPGERATTWILAAIAAAAGLTAGGMAIGGTAGIAGAAKSAMGAAKGVVPTAKGAALAAGQGGMRFLRGRWSVPALLGLAYLVNDTYQSERRARGEYNLGLKQLELQERQMRQSAVGQQRAMEAQERMYERGMREARGVRQETRLWEMQDKSREQQMQLLAMLLMAQQDRGRGYLPAPREPISLAQMLGR